jgi:microcompartment protein CcmK/EutM
MRMGKVVGTVVATQKNEKLRGRKLLVVEDINLNGQTMGNYLVAVDAVGAGTGEIVLTCAGSSARLTDLTKDTPVDGTIIAIVETVDVGGEIRYKKEGKKSV